MEEKTLDTTINSTDEELSLTAPGHDENHVSPGVQGIEATTQVWSKTALTILLVSIWLVWFVVGLFSSVQVALIPYVISDYASHSLIPTVSIISSILGGVTNFTVAKILDVFGRMAGFVACVVVTTIGFIMLAACQSIELYAAALVFYTVGYTGVQYTLSVLVADVTSLQNRGLVQALVSTPFIITCWLAGPISTAFLAGIGWPWAFGTFSIVVPVVSLPLIIILYVSNAKAKKQSIASVKSRGMGIWQTVHYYAVEFDVIGVILLSGGAALFLLPFNLYLLEAAGWSSPMIICMIVFGVVLLVIFVIWERLFATATFMPFSLLMDRTVMGACLLSFDLYFSYTCWTTYFPSFLQVVNELSITEASYVFNSNIVGFYSFGLLAGMVIRYTGRYKMSTLLFAIPLGMLGNGLMMYFRYPDQNSGYLVICLLINSVGIGFASVSDEIAALTVVPHQQIAATLAIIFFFGSVGTAVGLTVAGAIWQNVFPASLAKYLPESELPNLPFIYGDIVQQLSYEPGSPARLAIQHAYGDAELALALTATLGWILGIVAVLMWRNADVRNITQTKGQVA